MYSDADPGLAEVRKVCLALPEAVEVEAWGRPTFRAGKGKMFAVFELPDLESLSFKVEPALFPILTQREGIVPAPYLAHHSWIKVKPPTALPLAELEMLLRESYGLVARKLPKKTRAGLGIEI